MVMRKNQYAFQETQVSTLEPFTYFQGYYIYIYTIHSILEYLYYVLVVPPVQCSVEFLSIEMRIISLGCRQPIRQVLGHIASALAGWIFTSTAILNDPDRLNAKIASRPGYPWTMKGCL